MTLVEPAILPTDQDDDGYPKGLKSARLKCVCVMVWKINLSECVCVQHARVSTEKTQTVSLYPPTLHPGISLKHVSQLSLRI